MRKAYQGRERIRLYPPPITNHNQPTGQLASSPDLPYPSYHRYEDIIKSLQKLLEAERKRTKQVREVLSMFEGSEGGLVDVSEAAC